MGSCKGLSCCCLCLSIGGQKRPLSLQSHSAHLHEVPTAVRHDTLLRGFKGSGIEVIYRSIDQRSAMHTRFFGSKSCSAARG